MRPEDTSPPEIFYNETEAKKYTGNSRVIEIQNDMTCRALELLALPQGGTWRSFDMFELSLQKLIDKKCFLLDIGCGSGLSGEVLEDEGHIWVGMDISDSMLDIARDREVEGDLFLQDIGQGMSFRPGTFDGCISISVIQWLCNADKQSHIPQKRLARFFSTLFTCMSKGARCVFQFYPANPVQIEMIMSAAMKSGFTGGLVVDYPNSTKAKKYFLCLFAGELPKGLDGDDVHASQHGIRFSKDTLRERKSSKGKRKAVKDKDWVLKKKEARRKQGKATAQDSKYTARKRRVAF